MTVDQILFILVAALTLGSAMLVVLNRNLIHAALWLIASLLGVAILFVFLNAGFLAVVQVVLYIGAIAILMIFAIMLTRQVAKSPSPRFNKNWIWALIVATVFFGSLVWILNLWPGIDNLKPEMRAGFDPIKQLGIALVSPSGYLLAFELASVLLLAALIGAVIIAWERR